MVLLERLQNTQYIRHHCVCRARYVAIHHNHSHLTTQKYSIRNLVSMRATPGISLHHLLIGCTREYNSVYIPRRLGCPLRAVYFHLTVGIAPITLQKCYLDTNIRRLVDNCLFSRPGGVSLINHGNNYSVFIRLLDILRPRFLKGQLYIPQMCSS